MPHRRPGPQLQTIGDVPRHFLVQPNRAFSQRRVKFRNALNRLIGGLGATHDLDQRH
jgi:hypothetical protein